MAQIHRRYNVTPRELGDTDVFCRSVDIIYEPASVTIGDGGTGPFVAIYPTFRRNSGGTQSPDGRFRADVQYTDNSEADLATSDDDALGSQTITTSVNGTQLVVKADGSLVNKSGTIGAGTTVSSSSSASTRERLPLSRTKTPRYFRGFWTPT